MIVLVNAWIPLAAPSMNALHQIIYSQRRVELKPEVRLFKSRFKQYLPVAQLDPQGIYEVDFAFHQDWYFKNGTLMRKDVPNLFKVCLDALSEHYRFDDSRVWCCRIHCVKAQDVEKVGVQVVVKPYTSLV